MSNHFHDPSDKTYMRKLRSAAPDAFAGFLAFDEAVLSAESKAIPQEYTNPEDRTTTLTSTSC
ncbi:hypothetical protein [Brevibacterium ravenspurgense]|uniref:hypothetical protein n=1 Tax=Brevibacterium ravenspurgense TaxID=479117 RepID=UPI0003093CBB|nr:hypothetical protein [Brevibacterium ravenspurgense]